MRNHKITIGAIIVMLAAAITSLADVKIKTRQTMSGQSSENTTYIKGKRSRTESLNGTMINITQCDLRRGVQINSAMRTYMINEFVQAIQSNGQNSVSTDQNGVVQSGGKVTTTITTKDTGERKKMFGYPAKHLIITMETVSSPDACNPTNSKMQMDGWYIDAEFALDCDYGQSYAAAYGGKKGGCQDKSEVKQIGAVKRGYPVYEKMTMFDKNGAESFSIVNEVVELSMATLEASLFDIPADYRQVTDSSQLYATGASSSSYSAVTNSSSVAKSNSYSSPSQNIQAANQNVSDDILAQPKKSGTVRIGVVGVKTGAVGDGINAADLAAAVRNSLMEYLKVPNIEVVSIDAKLQVAIDAEAKQKECDYVLYASVSHKKGGGGGFGSMFGMALGSAVARTGIGQTGSTVGNVAGQIATQSIVSATTVAATVKSKDELTLDLRVTKAASDVLSKQFKAKAKSNGDDIISQVVEPAAQAIVSIVGAN